MRLVAREVLSVLRGLLFKAISDGHTEE
jgi:hypothetical protein